MPAPILNRVTPSNSSQLEAQDTPRPDWIAAAVVGTGFCLRLWMAQVTYFNTDEAWHYAVANQNSLRAAYRASLTLAHPPLMVVVLFFWKHLGTSDLMIRLPGVVAGTLFCWVFYKWLNFLFGSAAALCGLLFAALLPTMIVLSAEVRQYSWMLLFGVTSAYFLERALVERSAWLMWLSSGCLWLVMLSHYSAFLFAGSLGIYAIARMFRNRQPTTVLLSWATGQAMGVALAAFLYATHVARLGAVYPVAQPLQRFGDFYIADWYFHPGRDGLLHFLYRGTLGVFRFAFGYTGVGQIAAFLFVLGVVLLISSRSDDRARDRRVYGVLLLIPFVLNWIAVAAGFFPYGRTRQCVFLAIFGFAGVSIAISKIARERRLVAGVLALILVLICQIFGRPQGRDMLPFAEQKRTHMDDAMQFIRSHVAPADVILTDRATSFQLRHYLCPKEPVEFLHPPEGLDSIPCGGLRIASTGANDGALTPENLVRKAQEVIPTYDKGSAKLWVVQGGWASGLGEALRQQNNAYSQLPVNSFGRYLEVFQLTPFEATQPQRYN